MNHSKIHVSTFDPENQLGPEHDAEHWAAVTHIVQPVAYSWHNLDPQHWPAWAPFWGDHGSAGNPDEVQVQVVRGM